MTTQELDVLVLGGSAGALDALGALLPALPPACALAVAVVVHMPPTRPSLLVEVLADKTVLTVKEAEDKEPILAGIIYVAPPGYHLLVERDRTFALSVDEPEHFSRPAIDVLFESAADVYGARLAGILLSGANADGARGLSVIKSRGGLTVVQDPDDASSRTMPEAALARLTPDYVLRAHDIASLLARLTTPSERRRQEPR